MHPTSRGAVRAALSRMTIKYMHVRRVDPLTGKLCATGGVTVAYCVTEVQNFEYIYVTMVKCRNTERFCYAIGRQYAKELLEKEGPMEVLELTHPISEAIADWIMNEVWPMGSYALGYDGDDMGFAIDLYKDDKGRWTSTFEPSQSPIVFAPE